MKSIVYPVFSNRHVISHISLFFLFRFSRALAFTTVDQSCTAISWGETHGLYWLIFCIQYTRLNSFLLFALSCALPFSFHSILHSSFICPLLFFSRSQFSSLSVTPLLVFLPFSLLTHSYIFSFFFLFSSLSFFIFLLPSFSIWSL